MTDPTNTPAPSPSGGSSNHDMITIGGAALGIVLMLLGMVLPFVSIDVGGLSSTSGAFSGVGDDAWMLGISPGFYILIGVILTGVATWLVFAQRGRGPMGGKLYPLLQAIGGAGAFMLSGISFLYLDHRVRDASSNSFAGALGLHATANPSVGFFALFLGAACAVIGGAAGFITHAKQAGAAA